jgi:biopolymer transport protein ExbB
MKKLALIAIFGMLTLGASFMVLKAQDQPTASPDTSVAAKPAEVAPAITTPQTPVVEDKSRHQVLKEKFIEGGAGFMGIVALCLIVGMALAIERIIYLSLSTTNTDKLLARMEEALATKGIEGAKEVCRDTRGPVASIFYQGLERHDEGLDMVEKSIIAYGMVQAFDSIQNAGEISPALVAAGIKVALLTTVFGLIVAMILQVLYNYCLSKIDSITNDMENGSISFMDIMIRHNMSKK